MPPRRQALRKAPRIARASMRGEVLPFGPDPSETAFSAGSLPRAASVHVLDVLLRVSLPESDRLRGDPLQGLRLVFVHDQHVLRVIPGHPEGEGIPDLRSDLPGIHVDLNVGDLSITNDEIEVAPAEGTASDLIGAQPVEIVRATKIGHSRAAPPHLT